MKIKIKKIEKRNEKTLKQSNKENIGYYTKIAHEMDFNLIRSSLTRGHVYVRKYVKLTLILWSWVPSKCICFKISQMGKMKKVEIKSGHIPPLAIQSFLSSSPIWIVIATLLYIYSDNYWKKFRKKLNCNQMNRLMQSKHIGQQ